MKKLLDGKVWIFATLPLVFAHLLVISVLPDGLEVFLRVSFNLALLLTPVLAYVWTRDTGRLNDFTRPLCWGVVFICFPLAIMSQKAWLLSILRWGIDIDVATFDPQFPQYFFPLYFASALVTDALLWFSGEQVKSWRNLLTPKTSLIVGLSLSLLVCITNAPSWYALALWPQLFLVFLIFYGYYQLNARWLIPNLLRQRGLVTYGFGVVASVLLTYPLAVAIFRRLPAVDYLELELIQPTMRLYGGDAGATAVLIMVLSAPFLISSRWLRSEAERIEAELQLLKQQIDPHFFFNTLNNLYALSIDEDKRTPEVILRLSDLMRYVIYSGKEDRVPLEKSIRHLEDYQHLQGIRLAQRYDYQFTRSLPEILPEVPPLLFINLVENAFKHGIEPAEGPTFLHLDLRLEGNTLIFSCENSVEPAAVSRGAGMGLGNLKRRLSLLYPDRHELLLEVGPTSYRASLTIQL